jgi:hypothetical protein
VSDVFMNFGKHRGRRIDAVPLDYLLWAAANADGIGARMRQAIRDELDRRANARNGRRRGGPEARQGPPPPGVDWRAVVKSWFARLSKRYHADRGGSDEQMRVVNVARELLEALLKAAE